MTTSLTTFSTAKLSSTDLGSWNTSTRLLASLLSDRLVSATISQSPLDSDKRCLLIHGKSKTQHSPAVWIGLSKAGQQRLAGTVSQASLPAIFPGDFTPPVATTTCALDGEALIQGANITYSPSNLLDHLRSVIDISSPVDDEYFSTICSELDSSAANGANWIEWYSKQQPLDLKSSMLNWKQVLYTGHPLHPVSLDHSLSSL